MIVLHGIWSLRSSLAVWGEDSALVKNPSKQRGRKPKPSKPRPHPFACEADWLKEAIGQIDGFAGAVLNESELALLLPSSQDAPLPSPYLLSDEQESRDNPALAQWIIPTLELAPNDSLNLLLSLPEGSRPGVIIGESLKFFAEAAKLALEFAASGRVLPSLVKRSEKFSALWLPIADGETDTERLRLLIRAMPAVCRAEAAEGKEAEGRKPDEILQNLLESIVDSTVRSSLADLSLTAARGERRPKGRPAAKSASAAFAAALTSKKSEIDGNSSELEKLQKLLLQWKHAAFGEPGALRTCFRLSPPPDDAKDKESAKTSKTARKTALPTDLWQLEFLLQAMDDKSLLVPAETVWKTKGEALVFSSRRLENPQEKLLGDLGRAVRLYSDLERSLKTAVPTSLALDIEGAYQFLREAAPLLEQAGFGVLVPTWWTKPTLKLGAKLKVRSGQQSESSLRSILGIDAICKYRWEIALGDEAISFEDFIKLASLKQPLVKVRGQWVELKPEEIEAALAFFKKRKAEGEMTFGEALRMGLGIDSSKVGLQVSAVEAEGVLGDLLGKNGERRLKAMKTPKTFSGKLRPYQERGLSWLSFLDELGLGSCLADDMGLGKTPQLLSLLLAERETLRAKPSKLDPTLLICPMSVVGNWQREAERFGPSLKVHVHHGAKRESGKAFAKTIKGTDIVITTYALAARDRAFISDIKWRRVVLDEAQNIKNASAKQTQAVRSIKAPLKVALTGTPVENRLSELWSIMEFLNPGLLGSAGDFRERFATPIERYRNEERASLLKRLTGPFILRRLKTDKSIIQDLPEKIEIKTFCNLTKEQASLYQAVVDEMLKKIEKSEGIERKGLVLAVLLRLKQVCNHPVHYLQDGSSLEGRSGKLARIEELIEEILAEGDKALCFTQFAEMGHMLKNYLQERFGREILFLHGQTSKKARDAMVARFQDEKGPPLFLLSLKAGGTGLNLTAAQHVIHFDRWWNPAVEDQATDRAFRIGQKRNVQVRKFICIGTVEERIDKMIEMKKELAERIVGAGEGWITELSTAQLRELIALSRDAVAED